MSTTYEKGDRLHEAALKLQREKFSENYPDCLVEAARQFDSQAEHGQRTFNEPENERDWQADLDRRHAEIDALAKREGISYSEAFDRYAAAKQAETEQKFASKDEPHLHVMGREPGKPATASANGIPPGTLPGIPVLRPIAFRNGKFFYQPFPS